MVWTSPTSIQVAVRDRGESFTAALPPPDPQQPEPRGWGLCLIERLADRWGISRHGKTEVWFEMNADHAPGPQVPAVKARA